MSTASVPNAKKVAIVSGSASDFYQKAKLAYLMQAPRPASALRLPWSWHEKDGGCMLACELSRNWAKSPTVRLRPRRCLVRSHLFAAAKAHKVEHLLEALELDVTKRDSIQKAVARVLQKEGRIDALVNNAGLGVWGTDDHPPHLGCTVELSRSPRPARRCGDPLRH